MVGNFIFSPVCGTRENNITKIIWDCLEIPGLLKPMKTLVVFIAKSMKPSSIPIL